MALPGNQFPRDAQNTPIPVLSPIAANNTQALAMTGSAVNTTTIAARVVRIATTAAAWIEIQTVVGTNPTATETTSLYMPANSVEYFSIPNPSQVSAIGASGTVYVTPVC